MLGVMVFHTIFGHSLSMEHSLQSGLHSLQMPKHLHFSLMQQRSHIAASTMPRYLFRWLSLLSEAVRGSSLSDEEKLNYVAEIETIKAQLSKPEPDRNVVRLAWERLKPLASVVGVAETFLKVAELIGSFFGF